MWERAVSSEESTSTFWQRIREHDLNDNDNKRLWASGGISLVANAVIGAVVGRLVTESTLQALLYSLLFIGANLGVIGVGALLYVLHDYCSNTSEENRSLLPRP